MTEPIRVLVTGAAGQIAYSLLFQIAKGDVFGPNQPIILHLLDIPVMMGVLEGVVMELMDCALPLMYGVVPTADIETAFNGIEAAFLVGAMPRKEGMERKDLLAANVKIFKVQGEALDKYAKKTVKVLVVGNPANTNALICSNYAPTIPKENFSAMTRLDQNRATAQIAAKLGIGIEHVKNVIIWGNHSSTQYPDARFTMIKKGETEGKLVDNLPDCSWIQDHFINSVQKRGALVIAARKMSSAMSAAKAACDHMRDWWLGTTEGSFVSMGVFSNGEYGTPKNVVFSFPVTIKDKKWSIVPGLDFDPFSRSKIDQTAKELEEERDEACQVCQNE